MGFIILLIITTITIAGSAAYFSVFGLAQIFTGTFLPVIIMGTALEAGKLIAASFVYRYWSAISKLMIAYLISAIIVLMIITSMGIFGYLSSGYQSDILPIKLKTQNIRLLEEKKAELIILKQEAVVTKNKIDTDIASLPNNYVSGRIRLDNMYKEDKIQIREQLSYITNELRQTTLALSKLKGELLQDQVHIGPIIFIAEAFDATSDEATKFLILMIIGVFDPLAVVLTIGVNIALEQRKKLTPKSDHQPNIIDGTGLDNKQKEMLTELAAQKEITASIRKQDR